jgi:formate dehydrogenase iron-sulfur subunit
MPASASATESSRRERELSAAALQVQTQESEPGARYGFFTDTTLCIGCKACEVACKEWNDLPTEPERKLKGHSFDNTGELSDTNWRHVSFIEMPGIRSERQQPFQSDWLMMSDVCKHCRHAACVEACPTGALFYTEFGSVVVQPDICNGCGYCVPACPFGVVKLNHDDGLAHKCTLCYDRMKGDLQPACAKACPTESIQFGRVEELQQAARQRVDDLHEQGVDGAYLYGTPGAPGATGGIEELNAFFLLTERPEVYNLPAVPTLPSRQLGQSLVSGALTMAGLALGAFAIFAAGSDH